MTVWIKSHISLIDRRWQDEWEIHVDFPPNLKYDFLKPFSNYNHLWHTTHAVATSFHCIERLFHIFYIYEVEGLIWICVWILICDIDFHFGLFCLNLIDPSSYEIYTFLYIQHIKCVTLWRQQKKLIVSMWACFKFNFLSSFSWHVMKGNYLISNDLYVTSIYVRKVRVIFFNVAWK